MSLPYFASAAEHERLAWLGGGVMSVLLDRAHTDGQLSLFRSAPAAGSASPVHVHPDEDEIVVLLSGSAVFWVGERRFELDAGGVAMLPRAVPHTYRITSETADLLALSTPGGGENFFRAAGWDLSQPVPEGWTIGPAELAAAAAANGQRVLGPPLSLQDQVIPAALLEAVREGRPAG